MHPAYSPDIAPSDYHLFRSLQNFLNGKNFNNDDDVKSYLVQFFADKNQQFYERGIMMLKDAKRSLIKMDNTLLNKVISFYEKIVFFFLKEIRNYLVANIIHIESHTKVPYMFF